VLQQHPATHARLRELFDGIGNDGKFEANANACAPLKLESGALPNQNADGRECSWLLRTLDRHAQQKLSWHRLQILEENGLNLSQFDGVDLAPCQCNLSHHQHIVGEPKVTDQQIQSNIKSHGPIPIDSKAFQDNMSRFPDWKESRAGAKHIEHGRQVTSDEFPSLAHVIDPIPFNFDMDCLDTWMKFCGWEGLFALHADTQQHGHCHKPENVSRRWILTIGGSTNQTKRIRLVRVRKESNGKITTLNEVISLTVHMGQQST
jgi:hypothetical protein